MAFCWELPAHLWGQFMTRHQKITFVHFVYFVYKDNDNEEEEEDKEKTIYEPPPENHFCIFSHDWLPSLPRQPWLTVHPLFFSFCRGRNIERKVFFVGGWVCRRDQFFTSVFGHFWMGLMGGYYNQRRPYFKGDVQTEFWQNSVWTSPLFNVGASLTGAVQTCKAFWPVVEVE